MANISRILSDIFFGTQQSRYAAVAIFLTIAILCFFILFTSSDIPIDQRLIVVFFILIASIPSILFSLFELTCIVTGGNKTSRWWCYWLAWFISILIIVYCVFIIISVFLSMASYDTAMTRINEDDIEDRITSSEANEYAESIIKQYENDTKHAQEHLRNDVNQEHLRNDVNHDYNHSDPLHTHGHLKKVLHEEVVQPVKVAVPKSQNTVSGFDNHTFAPISNSPDSSLQYSVQRPSYNDPMYPKSSNLSKGVPEPFMNFGNNKQDYFSIN